NYSRHLRKSSSGGIGSPTSGQRILSSQALAKNTRAGTVRAQEQLAKIFRGKEEVTIRTGVGYLGRRKVDVWVSPNRALELKFGKDPVTCIELSKDISLREKGGTLAKSGKFVPLVETEYHFVDNPVAGTHYAKEDLAVLDYYGIPWHVWGPEFWEL
ncbi:MAG: hypothetical protein OK454_02195, partial [Thaumarchaeota archaeon]|nr:hypothetical protein [Nitrososphaerota archaeon]